MSVDPRTPADMLVNGGALTMALNVLKRGSPVQQEVAAELEKTAQRAPESACTTVTLPDFQDVYGKLARHEPITENEVVALLKSLAHFQRLSAYLADCHAATAEGLPASASKSVRGRHASICDTAAKGLQGDGSSIRHHTPLGTSIDRCQKAVNEQNVAIQTHDAKVAARKSAA